MQTSVLQNKASSLIAFSCTPCFKAKIRDHEVFSTKLAQVRNLSKYMQKAEAQLPKFT